MKQRPFRECGDLASTWDSARIAVELMALYTLQRQGPAEEYGGISLGQMIRATVLRCAVGDPAFACWRWNMQPAPVRVITSSAKEICGAGSRSLLLSSWSVWSSPATLRTPRAPPRYRTRSGTSAKLSFATRSSTAQRPAAGLPLPMWRFKAATRPVPFSPASKGTSRRLSPAGGSSAAAGFCTESGRSSERGRIQRRFTAAITKATSAPPETLTTSSARMARGLWSATRSTGLAEGRIQALQQTGPRD
jgi:hypothetical protein